MLSSKDSKRLHAIFRIYQGAVCYSDIERATCYRYSEDSKGLSSEDIRWTTCYLLLSLEDSREERQKGHSMSNQPVSEKNPQVTLSDFNEIWSE